MGRSGFCPAAVSIAGRSRGQLCRPDVITRTCACVPFAKAICFAEEKTGSWNHNITNEMYFAVCVPCLISVNPCVKMQSHQVMLRPEALHALIE